jgi:hypothetical protein
MNTDQFTMSVILSAAKDPAASEPVDVILDVIPALLDWTSRRSE